MLAPNIHCLLAIARANGYHRLDFAVAAFVVTSLMPSLSLKLLLMRQRMMTVQSQGSNLLLDLQRRAHGRAQPFLIELVSIYIQWWINKTKVFSKNSHATIIKTLSFLCFSILISCFLSAFNSLSISYHIRVKYKTYSLSRFKNTIDFISSFY